MFRLKSFYGALAGFALVISAQPAVALAQDAKPVQIESKVFLVQTNESEQGKTENLVPATSVVPGDTLAFTTSFKNSGAEAVTDFVIVNPVPESVTLSPKSAAENEVSVDGGNSWGSLSALTIAADDDFSRPATAEDVTHIRWTFSTIPAGGTEEAAYFAAVK